MGLVSHESVIVVVFMSVWAKVDHVLVRLAVAQFATGVGGRPVTAAAEGAGEVVGHGVLLVSDSLYIRFELFLTHQVIASSSSTVKRLSNTTSASLGDHEMYDPRQ